jgi:hypothetical protein
MTGDGNKTEMLATPQQSRQRRAHRPGYSPIKRTGEFVIDEYTRRSGIGTEY